jgi:hypothetical protein
MNFKKRGGGGEEKVWRTIQLAHIDKELNTVSLSLALLSQTLNARDASSRSLHDRSKWCVFSLEISLKFNSQHINKHTLNSSSFQIFFTVLTFEMVFLFLCEPKINCEHDQRRNYWMYFTYHVHCSGLFTIMPVQVRCTSSRSCEVV